MKGIVFSSFLDMVEKSFGMDMVDDIIEASDLASGGAYTAVGDYPHTEIVTLVSNLSQETKVEVPELLKAFGVYLYDVLVKGYPAFLDGVNSPLDFLESVENYIHVEVLKLYPTAQLPSFRCHRLSATKLEMVYESSRHLEDLCEGLILGCLKGFGHENAEVSRECLNNGTEKFVITL